MTIATSKYNFALKIHLCKANNDNFITHNRKITGDLTTHLLKETSWDSKAWYHHGFEFWIGVRGLHTRPLRGVPLLCSFDLTKQHRACGRCG